MESFTAEFFTYFMYRISTTLLWPPDARTADALDRFSFFQCTRYSDSINALLNFCLQVPERLFLFVLSPMHLNAARILIVRVYCLMILPSTCSSQPNVLTKLISPHCYYIDIGIHWLVTCRLQLVLSSDYWNASLQPDTVMLYLLLGNFFNLLNCGHV